MRNGVITVFGAASIAVGGSAYQKAEALGGLLAEAGFAVATGGYIGTMEAVSKGAAESGGHVIGVTCDQIERWRPVQPNAWVVEELRFATQRERLYQLIDMGQALIAMPGGVGTLSEIVLAWSLMQTGEIPERPLVIVGEGWKMTFEVFLSESELHLHPQDAEKLSFAADHEAAFETIIKVLKHT
jgi:uncharacterized protein (TIGR00730 family)